MMAINLVVVDGVASHVALRYDDSSKPELRWTLTQHEKDWPLYVPCCAVGSAAERLATEIEDGSHVVVTSGKLCYRKRPTQTGEPKSRMEILVWSIDRLTTSAPAPHEPSPAYGSGAEPAAINLEAVSASVGHEAREPATKARRPRYMAN